MKRIVFRIAEPVQREDGSWDVVEREEIHEYPDEAVRHCDMCTVCGGRTYPACTEECCDGAYKIPESE